MPEKYFIAIDGDDVGNLLRTLIISNDLEGCAHLSNSIQSHIDEIGHVLRKRGCEIVFSGGDSLLAIAPNYTKDNLLDEFPKGPCTVSVGIGSSPEYAYLALQLAKARGKDQEVNLTTVETDTIPKNLKLKPTNK
jgi:GTP cyclohydrolase III